MNSFGEGVESIPLACSLVLFVPAVGVLLLGRRRPLLVATWVVASWLIAWLRFTRWLTLLPSGSIHIAVGVCVVVLAVAAWRFDSASRDVAAVGAVSALATWTWVPCVGRELGGILNHAPDAPWRELFPTLTWLLGLYLPMIVIAAAAIALGSNTGPLDRRSARATGFTLVALVGALTAVTLYDDLANELARRSSY